MELDYIIAEFINIFVSFARFIFYISPILLIIFIVLLLKKDKDRACRASVKIMFISLISGIVFSILSGIYMISSGFIVNGILLLIPIVVGMVIILFGCIIAIIVWIVLKRLTLNENKTKDKKEEENKRDSL